jgi:gluconokinase
MSEPAVLALDIGTSSVRSALFDESARLISGSRASQEYQVRHSLEHGAELDPAVLLRATRRCLRQTRSCLTKGSAPPIAGSGFWHSLRGLVAINVGTSAAVRPIPAANAALPFGLFKFVVDQERDLLGGAISNAGNLRAWFLRELRLPEEERALERVLSEARPGATRLTMLPFLVGERAPTWPENLTGTIVGLSQATTAADPLRAAFTAVCFRLAEILRHSKARSAGLQRHFAIAGLAPNPGRFVRPRPRDLRRPGSLAPRRRRSCSGTARSQNTLAEIGKTHPAQSRPGPPGAGTARPPAKPRSGLRQLEITHSLGVSRRNPPAALLALERLEPAHHETVFFFFARAFEDEN